MRGKKQIVKERDEREREKGRVVESDDGFNDDVLL